MPTKHCVIFLSFLLTGAALAQAPGVRDEPAAPHLRSDVDFPDVYLDDSFEAAERLRKADRMAADGHWVEAATNLDQAADVFGDRLIADAPGQYRSVLERIRTMLCKWPAEGLATYRRIVDQRARRAFEHARERKDLGALLVLMQRYFCSSIGIEISETAGALAIESGRFDTARRAYRLLLEEHPDRAAHTARFAAMLAVAAALDGDGTSALAFLHEQQAGDETVHWMGQEQPARRIVEGLVAEPITATSPATSDWPVFGGNDRRNAVGSLSLDKVTQLWRWDNDEGISSARQADMGGLSLYEHAPTVARHGGMQPVFGEGTLFVQDAVRVWALDGETGRVLWRFTGPVVDDTDSYVVNDEGPSCYTPTCRAGRVYAALGGGSVRRYGYESSPNSARLVCLDAQRGTLIWQRGDMPPARKFASLDFDGGPLIVNGACIVIERERRAFGFESCFLTRLDAATGSVLSRTHLGCASTGGFGYRRQTTAIPAVDGDTAYVCTNLGTVAAVDVLTGMVRWLRMYTRDPGESSPGEMVGPWQFNPVVSDGARIICLPSDIGRALVLEKATGRIAHEIEKADVGDMQCLIGVSGGRLYGVGICAVSCDIKTGASIWSAALPEGSQLAGRGVLPESAVLVPTDDALCQFDRAEGKLHRSIWGEHGAGGNMIAVGDRLFVATLNHVAAYADKDAVLRRLREWMAGKPDDPAPALKLTEVLERNGDLDQAVEALTEAVKRAGGFAGMTDVALKRRTFDACMALAEAFGEKAGNENDSRQNQVHMYERASQCAPDATAQIRYRLELGETYARSDTPAKAVALYQQVLADPLLRAEAVPNLEDDTETAGEVCRDRIEQLIRAHGRAVYARQDRRADELIAAGRSQADIDILDDVIETYPNARALRTAFVAKGDLSRERGAVLQAARAYHQACFGGWESGDGPDNAAIVGRMADCFRRAERVDLAWKWCVLGARRYPGAIVRLGGRSVPFAEHAGELADQQTSMRGELPQLDPPGSLGWRRELDAGADVVSADVRQTNDWSRFYLVDGTGLMACHAATGEPIWPRHAEFRQRPDLLRVTPDMVLVRTQFEVAALDAATGDRLWSYGEYPAGLKSVNADHEHFDPIRYHALEGNNLVIVRHSGAAVCLEVPTGQVRWERSLSARPVGPVELSPAFVAFSAVGVAGTEIRVLDRRDGALLQTLRLDENVRPGRLLVTADETVVAIASPLLYGFNGWTGQRLWKRRLPARFEDHEIVATLDGVVAPSNHGSIASLRTTDGRPAWRSEPVIGRLNAEKRVLAGDDEVYVVNEQRVMALDGVDGRTLFEAHNPGGAEWRWSALTQNWIVAAGVEEYDDGVDLVVRFRRRVTGELAVDHLPEASHRFEQIDDVLPRSGALIVRSGNQLMGLTPVPEAGVKNGS